MQNSTDDEASDTQPTKRIVPRYHFDYPALSTNDVPIFSTKAFWECFHSSEARAFAKLICRIRNPRYKSGSAQEHQALLEQALPELLYPASTPPRSCPRTLRSPSPVSDRVIVTLDQPPDEYTYLRFPDLGTSPYFAADARPPTSQKQATDDELRNAPHLYRQLPNPIKKGKTPVKASKKRTHNSTDEGVGFVPFPLTRPQIVGHGSATPRKSWTPSPALPRLPPPRDPLPSFVHLRPSTTHGTWIPSDEESDEQTIPGTKRRAGRASKKQDRLRQKEREHKATEAIVDALTTQTARIRHLSDRGTRQFYTGPTILRTALGPGANYTKQKEDEKFTPIRSVPILSADQMELENAIRPLPRHLQADGPRDGLHQLQRQETEFSMRPPDVGSRINRLYHDLAESAQAFVPSMEIDVPRLVKSGSTAADASSLAFHLREDFIEGFRHYLEALSEHHSRVGSDSFNEAFAPSLTADARELLQDLIAEYNYLLDPAPRVEGSTSPHESRKGSTMAPSPPSDGNDHEGKGEGTSKFQGGAGGGD
ncbi:hypothetical protein B0H14DRAFT_2656211 [Mycena olivaceomarginata]|nr:hypothetical protein B0H14DRAFT_2656211 [Mycena olivaceomarginata]